MAIKYTLTSGQFPPGFAMSPDQDRLVVAGTVQLDETTFGPPRIGLENNLTAVHEHDAVNLPLNITVDPNRNLLGATIVAGAMPWGLFLGNAAITGTVSELLDPNASYWSEAESPQWTTPSGMLAEADEMQNVNIPLVLDRPVSLMLREGNLPYGLIISNGAIIGKTATLYADQAPEVSKVGPVWMVPVGSLGMVSENQTFNAVASAAPMNGNTTVFYSVVTGALPFGLTLNGTTGALTGTTTELYENGPNDRMLPVPSWITPPGTLGSYGESEPVNITLSATPNMGGVMTYSLVGGSMPFGLFMQANGAIQGQVFELYSLFPNESGLDQFRPAIQTTDLPPITNGVAVQTSFSATAPADRTIMAYEITSGALPWGLVLSPNGALQGTPTKAGTYTFTVAAIDSAFVNDTKTYIVGVN